MVPDIHDEGVLRQFVLGELNAEVRERIEEALIVDPEHFAELSGIEDELVLMYVRDELDGSLRARFVAALKGSPSLREHVENTETLVEVAAREHGTSAAPQLRRGWLSPFGLSLALAGAAVAVLAAVLIFRVVSERAPQTVVERAPATAKPAESVVSLFLFPDPKREDGRQRNVGRLPAGSEQAELRLAIAGLDPENLEAHLRHVRGADVPTTANPIARLSTGGLEVSLEVPARLLPSGDYLLTIIGDVAGRPRGTVATRFFSIE